MLCLGACAYAPSPGAGSDAPVNGDDALAGQDSPASTDTGNPGCTNIAFRSLQATTSGATDSIVIATPIGVLPGDLLIASLLYLSDSDEQPGSLQTPGGWTEIQQRSFGANDSIGLSMFRREVVTGEPATHTWNAGQSKRFDVVIEAYTGVDAADPIEGAASQTNSQSTNIAGPGASSPACGMIVSAFGIRSVSTFTSPANMDERGQLTNAQGAAISLLVVERQLEGAMAAVTATATTSAVSIGMTVALKP